MKHQRAGTPARRDVHHAIGLVMPIAMECACERCVRLLLSSLFEIEPPVGFGLVPAKDSANTSRSRRLRRIPHDASRLATVWTAMSRPRLTIASVYADNDGSLLICAGS